MIKISYKVIFILVFVFVVGSLAAAWGYKEYHNNGNILGFRIEKIQNRQYFNDEIPTVTVFFKENPAAVKEPTQTPVPSNTPVPETSVKIINYPQEVKLNENAAFTWEITGPPETVSYTAVVAAKESQKGGFDKNTSLSNTGYRELTKEFVNGSYSVPLVFVGNSVLPEYGTWHFRILAVIGNKNYWTQEYFLTVK